MIQGLDLSQWRWDFNFRNIEGLKYSFCYTRASVRNVLDPSYPSLAYRIGRAKLLLGPYHFLTITPSPVKQASAFVDAIMANVEPDLQPAVDLERYEEKKGKPKVCPNAEQAQEFIAEVKRQLPHVERMLIYTSLGAWRYVTKNHPWPDANLENDLWVADWGDPARLAKKGVRVPRLPKPWRENNEWSIWQYTSSGKIPGYGRTVDLDRARVLTAF